MKNIYILTAFLLTFAFKAMHGQYVLKNIDDVTWYINIPQEDIYLHYNSAFMLTGETLHYKVYCKNANTKELSNNSKIAYVKLVGQEGLVFEHKIRLTNGTGKGDFFVPPSIRSGNYKLIAYTRWMTNGSRDDFFQADLSIINPYANITFDENAVDIVTQNVFQPKESDKLDLVLDADAYDKRQAVNISLIAKEGSAIGGVYSLSINKKEDFINDDGKLTTIAFQEALKDNRVSSTRKIGEIINLPEFKGEMLSGMVVDNQTGQPVSGQEVALSILSKEAYQDIVRTNENGIFYFQLLNEYSTPKALIQVLNDEQSDFKLTINDASIREFSDLQFKEIKLHPKHKDAIIARSIHNQIENGYANVKQDKIIKREYGELFYGNPIRTYVLDDYKRFSTIAKTLEEVVDDAYHERKGGKQRFINVRERETDPYYEVDILPLIVVDGAAVQNHESILYFDANKVESISVLRDEYYYDKRVYQGVLMINTFDGDYYNNLQGEHIQLIDLKSPQQDKDYFYQDYDLQSKSADRIPDYRTQLLWEPNISLTGERLRIRFFTSDVRGTFEVSLEGFDKDGKPVSIKKYFKVE
ncbi:MAG: Ig-like domain-containing protein [Bacteroidia bacterium]|nr:Ig-like domain-containing protein [Bacteroidia bacterium]